MRDRKKVLENAKRYREKNPEKIREYKKLWRKKNYSKAKYSSKKATCKKLGVGFNIPVLEFVNWYDSQPDKCHYCGNSFRGKWDTQIDRKNPSDGYTLDNIVLACSLCNRTKSNVFTHDEWSEIVIRFNLSVRFKEIYDNHKNS